MPVSWSLVMCDLPAFVLGVVGVVMVSRWGWA